MAGKDFVTTTVYHFSRVHNPTDSTMYDANPPRPRGPGSGSKRSGRCRN